MQKLGVAFGAAPINNTSSKHHTRKVGGTFSYIQQLL
jgi:hypothetical protein